MAEVWLWKDRAPLGENLWRGEGTTYGDVEAGAASPGVTANSEPRTLPPGIVDHSDLGKEA